MIGWINLRRVAHDLVMQSEMDSIRRRTMLTPGIIKTLIGVCLPGEPDPCNQDQAWRLFELRCLVDACREEQIILEPYHMHLRMADGFSIMEKATDQTVDPDSPWSILRGKAVIMQFLRKLRDEERRAGRDLSYVPGHRRLYSMAHAKP